MGHSKPLTTEAPKIKISQKEIVFFTTGTLHTVVHSVVDERSRRAPSEPYIFQWVPQECLEGCRRASKTVECSSQSPNRSSWQVASIGSSTNTSSVIGVCMNATLKSAVAAKSEWIAESAGRILAAAGLGVPACTLGSVPFRNRRTTSRLRIASPFRRYHHRVDHTFPVFGRTVHQHRVLP